MVNMMEPDPRRSGAEPLRGTMSAPWWIFRTLGVVEVIFTQENRYQRSYGPQHMTDYITREYSLKADSSI